MATPVLELKRIAKEYHMGEVVVTALKAIDLAIHRNEYTAFIGSSGSGKSTLMHIIGCLDKPTAGEYVLNGTPVGRLDDNALAEIRNREIGFIFQSFNLLPRADALHNVMQPLIYRGIKLAERRQIARQALTDVGLADRTNHLPNQLSGGQRQRVAVARALVGKPAILLADEPTGNLDSATTADIMAMFDRLHSAGHTIVLVTHEPEIAAHCRRRIQLKDGEVVADSGEQAQSVSGALTD
jgi:putative ABC transport system ATP-binding protein